MIESKAKLIDVSKDWQTGKFRLTFELDHFLTTTIDDLKEKVLRLTVRRWHEKRSLDVNAYMWIILTAIAEKLNTSKNEVYEAMLERYGKEFRDDDGNIFTVGVKKGIDLKKAGHWKFYKEDADCAYWYLLKGTSQYDSAEMNYFVSRICEEAKELGIDTDTPDQKLEVQQWLKERK